MAASFRPFCTTNRKREKDFKRDRGSSKRESRKRIRKGKLMKEAKVNLKWREKIARVNIK